MLLLTSHASTCLKNSRNLGPTFSPTHVDCYLSRADSDPAAPFARPISSTFRLSPAQKDNDDKLGGRVVCRDDEDDRFISLIFGDKGREGAKTRWHEPD